MVSQPVVKVDSLTKQYGNVPALTDCSFSISQGEVFGLLGPNGSGKTTLLRLLMGFLRPTSGTATIQSLDCYRQSVAVHRLVAYLPGDVRLFRQMRARDVLKFFCRIRPDGDLTRALDLADRLGLDLSRQVAVLSTGMRQKLALAVSLSTKMPLLILDEPTANLDPTIRADVIEIVREVQASGRTVIFSSHVLSEAEQVCGRVGILSQGQLVHIQDLADLRKKHRIRVRTNGPLPPVPDEFKSIVTSSAANVSTDKPAVEITFEANASSTSVGELSPLLAWLATLSLAEVQIDPSLGLKAVYDRYHGENNVMNRATR